jgi:hypothetical protein
MNFLRKNWYYIGAVIFFALGVVLILFWNDMSLHRKLMIMSYMAVLFHQFEEYGWPGGFPAMQNDQQHAKEQRPKAQPDNVGEDDGQHVLRPRDEHIGDDHVLRIQRASIGPTPVGPKYDVVDGIMVSKKICSIYNPGSSRSSSCGGPSVFTTFGMS